MRATSTRTAYPSDAPAPYPLGLRVFVDAAVKVQADGSIVGGSPARLLRLSSSGRVAWAEVVAGPVQTAAGARLARRLTDIGVLHPAPVRAGRADATVVIPVRDRPAQLADCLDALGTSYPVTVVDDGSLDPAAIEAICRPRGVRLVVRPRNGGPAAARNCGLAEVDTELVLFLDSDCVPSAGLIERLAAHLVDPLVGAVAPRITARPGDSVVARYATMAGSLDLGRDAARVVARTRVAYVPTAALLVRRAALEMVARGLGTAGPFDPALRFGEDVDLVWRLDSAGWRVRYDPTITVEHLEPQTWSALLARRFRYGTSAGPLAQRHPDNLVPLILPAWPALAVAGLLTRRPLIALVGLGGISARREYFAGPASKKLPTALGLVARTWLGLGRWSTQFATPAIAIGLLSGGRRARSRRAALAALVLARPTSEWWAGPRSLDPGRYAIARIADDMAYGAGVVVGSLRVRTTRPLRPVLTYRGRKMHG